MAFLYLATSLETNSLELRTHFIDSVDEVPEQGDVLDRKQRKVVAVHVRCKESMSDIGTHILQPGCDFLDGIQEVDGHELDAGIGPGIGERSAGGNDDFLPVTDVNIKFGGCILGY